MLNFELNPLRYREEFQRRGRLQIRDFLQEEAAALLRDCLQKEVPWTLAYEGEGGSRTVPREEWQALDEAGKAERVRQAQEHARNRYGFAYESYMMVKNYCDGRDPGLILHPILEYLNSEEFLGFARAITGLPQVRRVQAQATRYRAGHFLRQHNDFNAEEGRLAAYVINLTPTWHPDWGGLLQFIGEQGRVVESFFPHWNCLSLFRVPQWHAVSGVMPYADGERLAITGWFQS